MKIKLTQVITVALTLAGGTAQAQISNEAKAREAAKSSEEAKSNRGKSDEVKTNQGKSDEAKSKSNEGKSGEAKSNEVQSNARPFGLDIVDKVQTAGSDEASKKFQSEYLPNLLSLVNERLGESVSVKNVNTLALDPSKLKLTNDSTARVYFLGEGAGYLNTLGFNTLKAGEATPKEVVVQDNAKLIFPNASSEVSAIGGKEYDQKRTMDNPLMPGDFVDLGKFAAGSVLDFFLISNGAGGGYTPFTADINRNEDQTAHVVSFAVADSPYLVIGFEDLWGGGDRDFNDLVFAVNIGAQNVKNLISTPEPTALLTMGGFLGMAAFGRRRRASRAALAGS